MSSLTAAHDRIDRLFCHRHEDLRARADRCRKLAATFRDEPVKRKMLALAKSYEQMADSAECIETRGSLMKRGERLNSFRVAHHAPLMFSHFGAREDRWLYVLRVAISAAHTDLYSIVQSRTR